LYDEPPKIKVISFFVNRLASIIFAAMLAGAYFAKGVPPSVPLGSANHHPLKKNLFRVKRGL